MNNTIKPYYDYTISPLGKLFYRSVWSQLGSVKNKKILDFGSGFGFTSSYLANGNDVTALEPNPDMISYGEKPHGYTLINKDMSALSDTADNTFDMVICHLVFEFTENVKQILSELVRVLKVGGIISVVKHNREGRIVQAVVLDYDIDDALKLLSGGNSHSSVFGDIKYYNNEDLESMSDCKLKISNVFGVRTLSSLHGAEMQSKDNWFDNMFAVESKLSENPDFAKIAFFNHVILTKK